MLVVAGRVELVGFCLYFVKSKKKKKKEWGEARRLGILYFFSFHILRSFSLETRND